MRTCFGGRIYASLDGRSILRFKNRRLYELYRNASRDSLRIIPRNEFIAEKGAYEAPRWVHSDILPGMSLLVDRP